MAPRGRPMKSVTEETPTTGNKRKSAPMESSSPKAKKHAVHDPVSGLETALMQSKIAESSRQMLVAAVRPAFNGAPNERHAHQETVIQMVGETLHGIKLGIEKVIQDSGEKIQNADERKLELDQQLIRIEKSLQEKQQELEEKRKTNAVDKEALEEAGSNLKAAKDAQKKGDSELVKTLKEKDLWESVLREQYGPLKEMTLPPAKKGVQYPPQFKALKAHWQKNKCDNAVIDAATTTLAKSPSDRSEFDNMVLKNMEDKFSEKIHGFTQILEAGEPDKSTRAQAVETAQKAVEDAQIQADKSSNLVETAENEELVLSSELDDAKLGVENHVPEIERIKQEQQTTQERLEEFMRITMGDFNNLRNGEQQEEMPVPEGTQ